MSSHTTRILRATPAGPDHQVVTTSTASEIRRVYRREPCGGCPWRKDQTGSFPAEAFRISANTARDLSMHAFGCHESGAQRPATCAGFLLRGAEHSLAVRMDCSAGWIGDDVHDGGHELHAGYVSMAVANGVSPDDPALRGCRLSSREIAAVAARRKEARK